MLSPDFKKKLSSSLGVVNSSTPFKQMKGLLDGTMVAKEPEPLKITDPEFLKQSIGNVPLTKPAFETAESTAKIAPAGGPYTALKDFLFKEVPIKLQPAFNKPSEAVTTKGTKSMELAYNLLQRAPEFFAGLPSKVLAVAFPGHEIPTPFGIDAGRLSGSGGKEGDTKLQTYGQDYLDNWTQADMESGLTGDQIANPANPRSLFHGTIAAINDVIFPSLAVIDAGNAAKEITQSFLRRTGFQETLGLKYSQLASLSEEDFVRTVTKRTKSVVDSVIEDVQAGKISQAEGATKLSTIRDEYKTLGDLYKGRVTPTGGVHTSLNKIGSAFEDVAIALNENVENLGRRNYAPLEGAIKPAEETLPGYRTEPGQAPAFGLSTERVEPVGFGDKGKATDVTTEKPTVRESQTVATGKKSSQVGKVVGTAKVGDKEIPIRAGGKVEIPKPEPSTAELFQEYTRAEAANEAKVTSKANEVMDNRSKQEAIKSDIEQQKLEKENLQQSMGTNEAKGLMKYRSRVTGELPEVTGKETMASPTTGKEIKNTLFGRRGDDVVTALGFKDLDSATKAFDTYLSQRKRLLEISDNLSTKVKDYREKKQIVDAVEAKLRKEGRDRAQQIALIQDFFGLGDAEFKAIQKNTPNFNVMTDERFQGLLKEVYNKSYDAFKLAEARMGVKATIFDRELSKVDNLQQAEKLPRIENMNVGQLEKFNTLLESFKQGDEFLGVRQLQTLKNTDLSGIHTRREVIEDLAKRTGKTINQLNDISVNKFWDRLLYDTALARKNPLYQIMVEDTNAVLVNASLRFTEFEHENSRLIKEARASRKRSLVDRLIPTDDVIVEFLEAGAEDKLRIMKTMTHEELVYANFISQKYAEARDYLVQRNQLKTRFWDNYYTHLPRGFLEIWKEGIKDFKIKDAISDMLSSFKEQEKIVNILDQKTGTILPLEKFMRFTLKREGFTASHDVARATTEYFKIFENKAALDQIVPKLDVYVHVLTPKKMTPRGLAFDDSLKTFWKEWMNNKKGRIAAGIIKQGSTAMWGIKAGIAFTRLLDLGLNIPVGIASHVGEQMATFVNLGVKDYATGVARYNTKAGREIAKKYSGFVGDSLLQRMSSVSHGLKDKFVDTFFALFASADRKANIVHLLGSMTPEEFESQTITSERLGKLKTEMGKYRVTHGDSSIWQKTASGQIAYQYKKWAEPIMLTTVHNIKQVSSMLLHGEGDEVFKTDEFQELLRATLTTAFAVLVSYGMYNYLSNKKNRTFLETAAMKAMNDSFSMLSALNPATYTKYRLLGFLDDLATSVSTISSSLVTNSRTADGSVPGVSKLESIFTPKLVKQFQTANQSTSSSSSSSSKLPALKRLDKIKNSLNKKPASLKKLENLKKKLRIK